VHLSVHSGVHLSIVLASANGSFLVWTARPAKFIQPLAPNFIEIDDNVLYVERKDEFDSEKSDEDQSMEVDSEPFTGLIPLTKKQRKLLKPIEISKDKPTNYIQVQIQTDDSFALLARKHIN
jgi:hypothetical protein